MTPLLGFPLQPDRRFLSLCRRIIEEHADYFEVSPETLWTANQAPGVQRGPILEIARRAGKPVVGHGLALSLGSAWSPRTDRWLERLREEQRDLGCLWYSDHLGFTEHAGWDLDLPVPLAPTAEAVALVARKLRALRAIFPAVAFENAASYFFLGDPYREPELLNEIARAADAHILLDLHNVHVQCRNAGLDMRRWLDAIDGSRVIEIHVAGGAPTDPGWLGSGRVFQLDSHDGPVPEEVWSALELMLPRCPGLRGVTVERIAAALDAEQVATYEREFERAREVLCSKR